MRFSIFLFKKHVQSLNINLLQTEIDCCKVLKTIGITYITVFIAFSYALTTWECFKVAGRNETHVCCNVPIFLWRTGFGKIHDSLAYSSSNESVYCIGPTQIKIKFFREHPYRLMIPIFIEIGLVLPVIKHADGRTDIVSPLCVPNKNFVQGKPEYQNVCSVIKLNYLCETWSSHCGEDDDVVLLGYDGIVRFSETLVSIYESTRRHNREEQHRKLPLPRHQPSAGWELKPITSDRDRDKLLLGQGCRTSHGAVIDEYRAVVEWWLLTTDHYTGHTNGYAGGTAA
jgi:hypothetical protein